MDKRCARCGLIKPAADFTWKDRTKDQRVSYCRACRAAYGREHYVKNRQRYIDNASAVRRKMIQERTQLIIDYLGRHPCRDCGETDVVVLEFDHQGDKAFSVSHGIREKSWALVLKEIEKCEVVCANCHRRRTARKLGFARWAATLARAGDGNRTRVTSLEG